MTKAAPPTRPHMIGVLARAVGSIALVFAIAVLGFDAFTHLVDRKRPAVLTSVKRDPMASYRPPAAARLTDSYEQDATTGIAGSSRAAMRRTFDVPARAGAAAFRDALAEARRAGWSISLPRIPMAHLPGDLGHAEGQKAPSPSGGPPNFDLSISLSGPARGQTTPAPGHNALAILLDAG